MLLFTIAFLIGDLYLQTFSVLPAMAWIMLLLVTSGIVSFFIYRYSSVLSIFLGLIIGFSFSAWYAHDLLSWHLPKDQEGKPILITGYIASLPIHSQYQQSFRFQTKKANFRLTWRDIDTLLKVGDQWKFVVKLKRIHSTQNPGTFDFESWAIQNKLRATGYVLSDVRNKKLLHVWHYHPVDQIRGLLKNRIQENLPSSTTSPWLLALMIGERENIPQDHWEILRRTGTNHLMAIGGLHIGMMAGFAQCLFSWLWRRFPRLLLRCPAQMAGAYAALATAFIYSLLAGFSLPTQRAFIMLTVAVLTFLNHRTINAWYAWSLALLIILLLNPLSVLSDSFWLSFGTIALIIYGMHGRIAPSGYWWKWGRVQWVIGMGLIPLTLFLFQECSLTSFFANTIAIPWLGFFILPLCFLSNIFLIVFPMIGSGLLFLADKGLAGLWVVLTKLAHLPMATWHVAIPNEWMLMLTIGGFLLLLLPMGFPGRWLGVIWLLPLFLLVPAKPPVGDIWMTLLDVGQGLSVVVQTATHVVVFDAGAQLKDSFDMGESVVVPYLHHQSIQKINELIISHGDNDHIGGAQALMNTFPIRVIKTSVPDKLPTKMTSYCLAGEAWQWDQVRFTFLYPTQENRMLGNDSSCVLQIDNGKQRILLTGDIEKYAEDYLLANALKQLPSTILVAPHHGSKTSAVKAFVAAVHPALVLYATGYRNRYHFPHKKVIETYDEQGSQQLNTVQTGAIQIHLQKNGKTMQIDAYRAKGHYWYSSLY